MLVDLSRMPSGERYEDRYGKFLDVFHQIAEAPKLEHVEVLRPPVSWHPLLTYLDCQRINEQLYFPQDSLLRNAYQALEWNNLDRTGFEVLCGFRPELVDALWKCDNEWNTTHVRQFPFEKEFVVTNNGSFFRQEVKAYLADLAHYQPTKSKVCLIPCSADKPPPSQLQRTVLDLLPDDYYLMIGTGVLGLVPQDLWPSMVQYDSGIPNQWRLMMAVRDYFKRTVHDRVVVYHDFYSEAIQIGLKLSGIPMSRVRFVNPVKFYSSYINLLAPERLAVLSSAF